MTRPQPIRCLDLTRGNDTYITPPGPMAICLGNFDGVHLAHQRLIEKTVALAAKLGAEPAAFCFFAPSWFSRDGGGHCGHALNTFSEKKELFRKFGIKHLFLAHFSDCRDVPADAFAVDWLRDACRCVGVCCGFNYTFGAGAGGHPDDLKKHFGERALILEPTRTEDGEIVSSSRIRRAIEAGDLPTANSMLGYTYSLTGQVVPGQQLGRRFGFPTANIFPPEEKLLPPPGVYATICTVGGESYRAVTNIGVCPTVTDERKIRCESFLRDFTGDLYGQTLSVKLERFLRPEQKFESVEALRDAIENDKKEAFAKSD